MFECVVISHIEAFDVKHMTPVYVAISLTPSIQLCSVYQYHMVQSYKLTITFI